MVEAEKSSLDESVRRLYARHGRTAERFCYTFRRSAVSPDSLPCVLFLGNHSSGKSIATEDGLGYNLKKNKGIKIVVK